jgi:hypothetical protein
LNNREVIIGIKKIATVKEDTRISAEWPPRKMLTGVSG